MTGPTQGALFEMPDPAQERLSKQVVIQGTDWLDGWQRQQTGMAAADAQTDPWWRSCCDAAIVHFAARGVPFDAYALAELGVPEPSSPNHWGPRLGAAANAGVIVAVGHRASRRPKTARSSVKVWQGAARAPEVAE